MATVGVKGLNGDGPKSAVLAGGLVDGAWNSSLKITEIIFDFSTASTCPSPQKKTGFFAHLDNSQKIL